LLLVINSNFRLVNQNNYIVPKAKILEKIARTHYLIPFHANNNNQIKFNVEGIEIQAVFECTYVRKDLVPKLALNKEKLPTKLDTPNVLSKLYHIIDYPPFVHQ